MIVKVVRYKSSKDFTVGNLFIDDVYYCKTLEDEYRDKKVMHETRIPEGTYVIKLRTFGGHHERYLKKFPSHKGMLWLQDVPNFKDILIHIGNTDADTSGCLLLGSTVDEERGILRSSTVAYLKVYNKISKAILDGETVKIIIS